MPRNIKATAAAAIDDEPAAYDHIGLRRWSANAVTVVAVSMAVLTVAVVAVLMGMA